MEIYSIIEARLGSIVVHINTTLIMRPYEGTSLSTSTPHDAHLWSILVYIYIIIITRNYYYFSTREDPCAYLHQYGYETLQGSILVHIKTTMVMRPYKGATLCTSTPL